MPNMCNYSMKVKGSKESRDKWLELMKDYSLENHFFRIFESEVYDEEDDAYYIWGDCAWSIESCCRCCRASGYPNGVDLLSVNTEDLGLVVEIWTEECGIGFQEHYIYDNGKCLADECEDFEEYFLDDFDSIEELNNEFDTEFTEDDFDEGVARIDGFDDYGEWHI